MVWSRCFSSNKVRARKMVLRSTVGNTPSRSAKAKAKSREMISFQTSRRTAVGRISYSWKIFSIKSFEIEDFMIANMCQKVLNFHHFGEFMENLRFLKKNCNFVSRFLRIFATQKQKNEFVRYLLVLCFSCVLFEIQRAGRFAASFLRVVIE